MLGPPPHGDDAIGRYIAFRQMEAHARAGRRGPLLAEAREVLGRRQHADVENDPASTAIMDIALRTLLASPVSDETLEVLESLGPPRERLGARRGVRAGGAGGGRVPVGDGDLPVAVRERHRPNRQLQDLARASVAAARAGDRAEFARTFRLLAGQEDRRRDADDAQGETAKRTARGRQAAATGRRSAPRRTAPDKADRRDKLDRRADGALIASAESEHARARSGARRAR